ncbi:MULTISPECIES: hypothetical protein [unclassified Crossiella]|uniref:phage terminase small subunit n=1 Tax=unclassified Crossiella TaxID=2620835 RepID=UPI001FFF04B1|nr:MULTISPECIES: hypothetical protein [unclassified Crossiella]MCK2239389.1 hypothetical protein [Crossiella sp. S99.2]MCK2252084.1 hypothetical protein [Crossiella sp. S99.1]
MALTGRPPSENPRNRNAKTYEWTTVEATPYTGESPDLPENDDTPWHARTLAWWEAVRRMPHCRLWTEGDWLFALETVVLVEQYWSGNPKVAAELRLRYGKLGLTHEDRLKLRIRYTSPEQGQAAPVDPAAVTRLADRRRRLGGAP